MRYTLRYRTATMLLLLAGCGPSDGLGPEDNGGPEPFRYDEPWPTNLESVLVQTFTDARGDQEQLPPEQAGPPYQNIVPFPSVDVTRIRLGMDAGFLYMSVDFAGPIPTDVVHIPASGEVEEQWVRNQGMNIALNTDGDPGSGGNGEGVSGVEIFFAVSFDYPYPNIYANYGFPSGDIHGHTGQVPGELGPGGAGFAHATVRYRVDDLGAVFPVGETVEMGSWSEAESFDAAGNLLYHHFAFDRVLSEELWTIR